MPEQDRYCLNTLRAQLLEHPVYAEVASVSDLRRFKSGLDRCHLECVPPGGKSSSAAAGKKSSLP
jgi:hypothetical protein